MKYSLSLLTLFVFLYSWNSALFAQEIIVITDEDLQGSTTYEWTSDNEYILDGIVYLESGGVLFIEAGTVIRGREEANISTGHPMSTLIIAKGAKIFAEGTRESPIIFTAESDGLDIPDDVGDLYQVGWGGLILLGDAPIASFLPSAQLFDVGDFADTKSEYGGVNPLDNSGLLRYVSIRHVGGIGAIGGLTLAGVGSQTGVNHIEVYKSTRYAFTFIGGTVNTRYLVAAYSSINLFEIRDGYTGKGQFWLGVAPESQLLTISGGIVFLNPLSKPQLANITLITRHDIPGFARIPGQVQFTSKGRGTIKNALIINGFPSSITLQDDPDNDDTDSYSQLLEGQLQLTSNAFINEGVVSDWSSQAFTVDRLNDPQSTSNIFADYLGLNNDLYSTPQVINSYPGNPFTFSPLPIPGSDILDRGIPISDAGFTQVTYQGAFDVDDNWIDWTQLSFRPEDYQVINGNVTRGTEDCLYQEESPLAAGVIVQLQTGENIRYTTTDQLGNYATFVPEGTTTATVVSPGAPWGNCPPSSPVTLTEGRDTFINLTLPQVSNCAQLEIEIGAPFLRRGFQNSYYVTYRNTGSATAGNAKIGVLLSPEIEFVNAGLPLASQAGDTLFFAPDNIAPLAGDVRFAITVFIPQETPLGQEHCSEVFIRASNECPLPGGPQFRVEGSCEGDSILFKVFNIGDAPAGQPVPYIVVEDEVMLQQGTLNVNPGESLEFRFAANGNTMNFSTQANPNNFQPNTTAVTVSCEATPSTNFSSYPVSDFDPGYAIDCQPNIGSYDPNDKMGIPEGVSEQRIVPKDVTIDYRIRFQNTGTDTAFKVVVVDTLSPFFNPASLKMGSSSHPYTWRLEGERTLKVTFDNIILPDSFVNEPASNGFFKFQIRSLPDLPFGTQLENNADIYFDFNIPVRTNTTYHRIDLLEEAPNSSSEQRAKEDVLDIYPQPATAVINVAFKSGKSLAGTYNILSADGRVLSVAEAVGQQLRIPVAHLPQGVYLLVLRKNTGQIVASQRFVVGK
jgi:uncharacterized repeat protein (TIGR01451 family)